MDLEESEYHGPLPVRNFILKTIYRLLLINVTIFDYLPWVMTAKDKKRSISEDSLYQSIWK